MIINKEKAVCFAAGGILFLGILYAAGSWPGTAASEVKITPPDSMPEEPRFVWQEPRVFEPAFMQEFFKNFAGRANPFQADSGRRPATPSDYPLPAPWGLPVAKMVPVSGTLGNRSYASTLTQKEAPKDISPKPKPKEEDEEFLPDEEEDENPPDKDSNDSMKPEKPGKAVASSDVPKREKTPAASPSEKPRVNPPPVSGTSRPAPPAPSPEPARPAAAKSASNDFTDEEIDQIIDESDDSDYLDEDENE